MPGGTSAYLAYANANRDAVRVDLLQAQGNEGKIGIAQLGKELGSRWRQLTPEEKEKYKQLAIEQNEKRAAALAAAKENGEEQPEKDKQAKASKQGLPTAVLKRLILSDPELKRISGPALNLVNSTAECFIGLLTQRAKDVAVASGRKTIRYDDIETVAREGGWRTRFLLDHLKEVAPLIQKTSAAIPGSAQEEERKENVVSKAAPVRRITDFFSK